MNWDSREELREYHRNHYRNNRDKIRAQRVPLCVNPKHLFLGTNSDNVADRKAKGRCGAHGKPGEGCGHAKLTNRQVHMIRKDDRPHHLIAQDFGVARTTVVNIKKRRTWKHI